MPATGRYLTLLVPVSVIMLLTNLEAASVASARRAGRLKKSNEVDSATLGVIADVQYADRDDGWDYSKSHKRAYRRGLHVVKNSVKEWRRRGVTMAVNLGDLLDGWNYGEAKLASAKVAMGEAMEGIQWAHNVGNHEFYNREYGVLADLPKAIDLSQRWTLIMLNSYAVSVLTPNTTDRGYVTARKVLMTKNKNLRAGDMRPGAAKWLDGVDGLDQRYIPVNGGLGMGQLFWLSVQLRKARLEGRYVVVATHVPLHPMACQREDLAWDYKQALNLLSTEGRGVVSLVLSGHDHQGGFATLGPTPFITLPSPLENPSFSSATVTLRATPTHATITAEGLLQGNGEYATRREPAAAVMPEIPGGL
eukprot:TRINITY_DN35941_c0_g1_i1.p1 TRINITY_DN35941_c0_g1~~TRINITY_DN35941_c0_g1_i1.p1  ORF type:complete len:392 (+),score=56.06 TRINITY_DN35941_c0_g1_i1:90-1178(+)